MKWPHLDSARALSPAIERLLAASRERQAVPLTTRERSVEVGRFLVLAGGVALIAAVSEGGYPSRLGLAAALIVAYAVASSARFEVGAGYMVPTQLVFIPMLLLLPPWLVPVAAALGVMLARVPDAFTGRIHPGRLAIYPSQGLYSVGPALVIALAGAHGPKWSDAPVYLIAFVAQVAFDVAASTVREWLVLQVPPRLQIFVLARVYMVDALLTPVGLLAAFAGGGSPYRALLVLPLVALLGIFAQDREAYIQSALELSSAYRGTALLLGDVLEDKDAYTASHSHGVVSLSLSVADRLGLDPAARRRVEFGALLHDIGKIAVPAEIINKPGPLDDEEWAVMKLHTVEGQGMLDRVGGVLAEVGRVVRTSHEHFDGRGYPDGLAGEAIPIEARIVCCCDAFSAMTTTRTYRKAMSFESAREELIRNSGSQFDPQVVAALLEVLKEGKIGAQILRLNTEVAPAP